MAMHLQLASRQSVTDVLLNCTQGHLEMLRHSTQVSACSAPVLQDPPDWYGDFLEAWSGIVSHAMTWADGILPLVHAVPHMAARFGERYGSAYQAMQPLLATLSANPKDQKARAALADQITPLLQSATDNVNLLESFEKQLADLAGHFGPDRQTLIAAVAAGENSIRQDLQIVSNTSAAIDELNGRLHDLEDQLTSAKIVVGVSAAVVIGSIIVAVGASVEAPTHAAIGRGLLVIGTGLLSVSIYQLITLNHDIAKLRDQISVDTGKMNAAQSQVLALRVFDKTLSDLIAKTQQGSAVMDDISKGWSTLANEMTALGADLQNAEKDMDAGAVDALRRDLQDSANHWAALQPLATGLASINIRVDSQMRTLDGDPIPAT